MATIDLTINGTLEVDDDTWYETLEAFDGDVAAALDELTSDIESSTLDSIYGEAWVCSADSTGFIDRPGKDRRPL